MSSLQCIVVTPEKTALEQSAQFVALPLFDGELGVAHGHSPMIGRLGFGELRIRQSNGQTDRYYLDGGFVQVADDVITILTGRFMPAREISQEAADEQLKSAMKRSVATDEELQLRDRAVDQARSQIRVSQRVGR